MTTRQTGEIYLRSPYQMAGYWAGQLGQGRSAHQVFMDSLIWVNAAVETRSRVRISRARSGRSRLGLRTPLDDDGHKNVTRALPAADAVHVHRLKKSAGECAVKAFPFQETLDSIACSHRQGQEVEAS
jgi:hypothetical protein